MRKQTCGTKVETSRAGWCVPFEGSRVAGAKPTARHRAAGCLSWSWLLSSVVRTVVSALVGCAAPIIASSFLTDRDGLPCSSVLPSSKEGGVILVSAWLSSRVRCVCVGPFALAPGRLPWGLVPLRGVDLASPLTSEHPKLAYVPPSAFRTLSTAFSSQDLADLFHSAATSRIPAPGLHPRPSCTTSSVAGALAPLAPPLCRRFPDDAKLRRVDLRALFQVGIRCATARV